MKERIFRLLPKSLQMVAKQIYYFPIDTVDLFSGRRDPLTPPRRIINVGAGDFRDIGEEFLRYFQQFGDLKPNESVLDVGCGVGRMAVPLTGFLNEDGGYEGFDIVKRDIDWCNKNIVPKCPNFHFQHVDILNRHYNPRGKYDAAKYSYPYQSGTFNFVFLTSVFTHMMPQEMENYFYEVSRVLRKGGKCLVTFFLLNEESSKLIDRGKSTLSFKYDFGNYRVIDRDVPETAVAYDEQYIRILYKKYGITIIDPTYYGSWCGRQDFLSYQDIIVATKA